MSKLSTPNRFAGRAISLYINSFAGLSREVWLLTLVTMVNRSGAMVIPFLTVYLTQVLGFTLPEAGWVMSTFGLGSIAGSFLGGYLTDKWGYYNVQFWSLSLAGFMFIILKYAQTFPEWCLLIFFTSLIADTFRPANLASVSAYSKPENHTRSRSLIRLGINLGFTMGPLAGGILAASVGYDWLFIINGIAYWLAAAIFRLTLEDKPEPESNKDAWREKAQNVKAYKDKVYILFLLMLLMNSIAFMQLFTTLPVFLKQELLVGEGAIGSLYALNGFMIFLMEMPLIYWSERKFDMLGLIAFGILLTSLCYAVFLIFGSWFSMAYAAMIFVTVGEMIVFPFSNTWAAEKAQPEQRGQYMGLYTMVFSCGFVIAPSLGMNIANYLGFQALWLIMTLLCIASSLGIYRLRHQLRLKRQGA